MKTTSIVQIASESTGINKGPSFFFFLTTTVIVQIASDIFDNGSLFVSDNDINRADSFRKYRQWLLTHSDGEMVFWIDLANIRCMPLMVGANVLSFHQIYFRFCHFYCLQIAVY